VHRIWVNGVEDGGVPGDDPGLLLGLTVFETVRTYGGVPFRLQQHVDRLVESGRQMGIALPTNGEITSEIQSYIGHAQGEDVRVRYTVTDGGQRIVDCHTVDSSGVGAPIRLGRLDWDPPEWLPGVVKHGSRASWIVAARQQEVDEVLLVDRHGFMLEANRSNVFAVVDGVVWTPPLDDRFLAGVTRGALLDAAHGASLPIEERSLPFEGDYDEFYVSSSLKELAPVVWCCGREGPGAGPVGRRLHDAFRALVASEVGHSRG
jgi:branched-chain amino acid aminotransferase